MEPFPLHDGDLVLSVPTSADVDRITELCQDPEVQRWTTVPSPYTRAHAESFVADLVGPGWRHGSPTWALRVGDRLVGMVGLAERDHPGHVEIGYWLGAEARGAGVMSRAVGLVLDAAFGTLGVERVEWRADVGNWPSWRDVWRHGFRREGTLRGVARKRGKVVDQWVGSLLRGEPREPATPWEGPRAGTAAVPLADPTGRDPEALVRQFHDHFGVPVATDAASVARERVALRMELVAEEFAELVTAVYGAAAGEEVASAFPRAVAADDGARDTVA